jgi:hypothetical protein
METFMMRRMGVVLMRRYVCFDEKNYYFYEK